MKKQTKPLGRAEFTKEELKLINKDIDLLIKTKFTESERVILREINQEREAKRQERVKLIAIEVKPVESEIQKLGIKIDALHQLNDTDFKQHSDLLPILIRHLKYPYFDTVKSIIASALGTKEAYSAWPVIVDEYRNAPQGRGITVKGDTEELSLSYKDSLANTLCDLFRNERIGEYLELLRDKKNGSSRILLLAPLRSRYKKNLMIKEVLFELKADPDLVKEIASWKINWM
jgi:hypothetical protein